MDLDEYNAIVENTVPHTEDNKLGHLLTLQMASIQGDIDPINVCVVGSSDSAVEDIIEYVRELHSDVSFIRQGTVEKSDLSTSDLLVQYIDGSVTRQQFMDLYDFDDFELPDTGLIPNDKAVFTVASSIHGEFDESQSLSDQNPIDRSVWSNYDFVIYVEPYGSGGGLDSPVSIEEVNVDAPTTENTEEIHEQLEDMIKYKKLHHEYMESDVRNISSLLNIIQDDKLVNIPVEHVYGLMKEVYSYGPQVVAEQSPSRRDRVKSIVNAINSLNEDAEEYITEEEVIEYLGDQGFEESKIEEEIEKMKRDGEAGLYSPNYSEGYLAVA